MGSSYNMNADQGTCTSDKNPRRNSSSSSCIIVDPITATEPQPSAGLQDGHSRPHLLHRHHRRRFDPIERAEVAAVRRAGACIDCHARKVKCRHTIGSATQPSSIDSVHSDHGSSHTESSHLPSLSNSISVLTSPEQSTILQRNLGGNKMQDSVMLEKFVHEEEGSLRWLERKAGNALTTTKGRDEPIICGDSKLKSLISYPQTLDLTSHTEDNLIVFPAHTLLPGEQTPWELSTGRETTQPRRSNTQKLSRSRVDRRRVAGGVERRRSNTVRSRAPLHDGRLSHDTLQTTRALADMTLNPADAAQQLVTSAIAEAMNETWGEQSGQTIQPDPQQSNYQTQYPGPNAHTSIQQSFSNLYAPNTSCEMRTAWPRDDVPRMQDSTLLSATSRLGPQYQNYPPELYQHSMDPQSSHDFLNVDMAPDPSFSTNPTSVVLSAFLPMPPAWSSDNRNPSHETSTGTFTGNNSAWSTGVPMTSSRSSSQERSNYTPLSSFSSYRTPGSSSNPHRRAESITEGIPSSFNSSRLSPGSYMASNSPRRVAYLPQSSLALPQTPYGMSRQPSLAGQSASSRDDAFPMSPQLSRQNYQPQNYFGDASSPSLQPVQNRATDMQPTSPFPPGLDVEYADGAYGNAPLEPYEHQFTEQEIDELLRTTKQPRHQVYIPLCFPPRR